MKIEPGMLCVIVGGGTHEGMIVQAIKHCPDHFIEGRGYCDLWLVKCPHPLIAFRNGDVRNGDIKFVSEGHVHTSWLKPVPPEETQDERREERVHSD